ncbi:MAG: proline dehydrogenase family protein [Acidobacteriales bacterium]|nr:proline dehydrogenase family protein [Terriglobales bacterium]
MLRAFFITLSENRQFRHIAESSSLGQTVSHRFVAGMTAESVLDAAAEVNRAGMSVSIDNLGENVTNAEESRQSAALYHQLLDEITQRGLNANVSLKLTHMGYDVDPQLAGDITHSLVQHASRVNNFVRVDMEGSPYTQKTIDMVRKLHAQPGNAGHVGTVIQSYLYRSEKDIETLLSEKIRIRLCKGAYKEPAEIAFPRKEDVDANYIKLAKTLMKSGIYHGLATHDERIINELKQFAKSERIANEAYEFQMLYGIRRDLQGQLAKQGYGMRVYIPFGTEWYPYFMRRLAERPANALFIAKNLLRA